MSRCPICTSKGDCFDWCGITTPELQNKCEELENINSNQAYTIKKLIEGNRILCEALEFYKQGYAHAVDDSHNAYFENGHIRLASGKRAKEALKKL
jgi:beta-galactosidase beta subunit